MEHETGNMYVTERSLICNGMPAPRPATPIAGTWDSLPPKVDEAPTATAPWKNRFNQQQNGSAAQQAYQK